MPYKDMLLVCRECGASFYFTAGEQEFYADKGFLHEPTRCPRCRAGGQGGAERASQRDGPRKTRGQRQSDKTE